MNIPLDEWSGAGATKELHQTIIALNDTASKQTKAMIGLTWAIAIMTLLMLVAVIVQIIVAVQQASAH